MNYTPVYPDGVAREAYEAALEKCVFGGGWLFNQGELDVWFDFEGFVVKVPAGTRVRPDGWTHVRNQVSGMDTEEFYGCQSPVNRSGFKFLGGGKVKDFSCLQELHNLECLHLDGGQTLPDLSFLRNMPKLRIFTFSMTVEDGDLRPCLDVPYVYCYKIKRHYNLKGKDLPNDESVLGFELI